ncbi:hypothetical protein QVD17_23610 [Tagetes erecta]|uniref:Uncharacterized protein n=1 Tax=Tagetes erecta TaxID=13708 RepID=A0AAD8NUL6_TARER|nr:hypothetical protein QVD17_23610 [Tagetes erecta]
MTALKPIPHHTDNIASNAGKFKPEKSSVYYIHHRLRFHISSPKCVLWWIFFVSLILMLLFLSNSSTNKPVSNWECEIKLSAKPRSGRSHTVLVTGVVGFIGAHASVALKRRGDGVVGLDNFNRYYDGVDGKIDHELCEEEGARGTPLLVNKLGVFVHWRRIWIYFVDNV